MGTKYTRRLKLEMQSIKEILSRQFFITDSLSPTKIVILYDVMDFKKHVLHVPDFPKRGIAFLDITPILCDAEIFQACLVAMAKLLPLNDIDVIAGIELRGVIFAAAMAAKFHKGFLPVRKAGKLPPPTLKAAYDLEYGQAEIEVRPGSGRIALIDDVLATGGTLGAATELLKLAGYDLRGVAVLADIRGLNQMKWNGKVIPSLLQY